MVITSPTNQEEYGEDQSFERNMSAPKATSLVFSNDHASNHGMSPRRTTFPCVIRVALNIWCLERCPVPIKKHMLTKGRYMIDPCVKHRINISLILWRYRRCPYDNTHQGALLLKASEWWILPMLVPATRPATRGEGESMSRSRTNGLAPRKDFCC